MAIRGIEHVGLTVPDISAAETFFERAFGAVVLYRQFVPGEKEQDGADMTETNGLDPEKTIRGLTMMRLANGANIELFQFDRAGDGEASDIAAPGFTHIGITVDDLEAATRAAVEAGARPIGNGPTALGNQEEGEGNATRFVIAPFGAVLELMTLPAPLEYDGEPGVKRWLPQ